MRNFILYWLDTHAFGIAEVLARARAGSKPNLWPRCDLHALVCLLFIVVCCGAGERVHAAFMLSSVYFAYFACERALSLMRWAGERESGLNVHLSLMRWARIACEFESHAWAGERDMRCECEFELRLKR